MDPLFDNLMRLDRSVMFMHVSRYCLGNARAQGAESILRARLQAFHVDVLFVHVCVTTHRKTVIQQNTAFP